MILFDLPDKIFKGYQNNFPPKYGGLFTHNGCKQLIPVDHTRGVFSGGGSAFHIHDTGCFARGEQAEADFGFSSGRYNGIRDVVAI
ncbi:MAG: hypothetical protein WCX65_07070 [bacterium]